jgi:hypothetical protein
MRDGIRKLLTCSRYPGVAPHRVEDRTRASRRILREQAATPAGHAGTLVKMKEPACRAPLTVAPAFPAPDHRRAARVAMPIAGD